jgi:hypothetical protein
VHIPSSEQNSSDGPDMFHARAYPTQPSMPSAWQAVSAYTSFSLATFP